MKQSLLKYVRENLIFLTWLAASGAVIGSIILSEVMDLEPCKLCWYQRIAMFPLVFILGVGVKRNDRNVPYYVLPLSIVGAALAFYHSLLQWGVIEETSATCSIDTSCAFAQINWFGFLTIPFGAFLSFVIISWLMIWQIRLNKLVGLTGEKET